MALTISVKSMMPLLLTAVPVRMLGHVSRLKRENSSGISDLYRDLFVRANHMDTKEEREAYIRIVRSQLHDFRLAPDSETGERLQKSYDHLAQPRPVIKTLIDDIRWPW
jgi:hypothetical protein